MDPLVLAVDYDGADDFIADYNDNLSSGGMFVLTPRTLAPDTAVLLRLSFPGLIDVIAIDAVVKWSRGGDAPGVGVQFSSDTDKSRLAALVERIRNRDTALLARVVKVLVVDDNQHIVELICAGLRATANRDRRDVSFEFQTAANGADAIAMIQETRFDLVIVDMYMPIVDGAGVITKVRGDLGLPDLPVIAVSAGGITAKQSALQSGASLFIEKPIRLRQLVDSMRELRIFADAG
jgi:uncharacterized protein (TIGR02266 family)